MLITQARLKEICTYDPESGLFEGIVNRGKKYKVGDQFGKEAKKGYLQVTIDGRTYRLHRLAWLYVHGYHPPAEIDHKNGIPYDNRMENLRLADKAQNAWNRKGRPNRAMPKNVTYHEKDRLYVVMFSKHRKLAFCKSYRNLEDAAQAALRERERLYGEFKRD